MINEELDVTVMMITHNMDFAQVYGNRKVEIKEGVLKEIPEQQTTAVYAM